MASNSISIIKAQIPLLNPYHLSFAKVETFDCTFCKLTVDGLEFWGETTALPGYSWETSDSIERVIKTIVEGSDSLDQIEASALLFQESDPFAVGCIFQAIDKSKMRWTPKQVSMPLVGIVSSSDLSEIERELEDQIARGFQTIKVKVQGNLNSDRNKILHIQSLLPEGIKIRIDANQGYEFGPAMKFVALLDPMKVELFEQPFKPNQWDEMKRLYDAAEVPLMLDESIWISNHVELANESGCADFIKLKMQKHGGLQRTIELINYAKESGFKVVFGNGVQSVLGCYDEVLIAEKCGLNTAGEYNGFLKHQPFASEHIWFLDGAVHTSKAFNFSDGLIEPWVTSRVSKKL